MLRIATDSRGHVHPQRPNDDADVNQRGHCPPVLASLAISEHCYRGVTFDHDNNSWRARLYCAGRHITLGRFATAKLAAESHDLAAFYVRGEGAVTNFGIAAARNAWQVCPQIYSPVLQRSLQAAIARLHDIGAGGGAKAGMQQWHPHAGAGFAGGPIGPIDAQAVAARMVAATMAGAGPSPGLMIEVFEAVSHGYLSKTSRVRDLCKRDATSNDLPSTDVRRVAEQVLILAAMRAPASWA